MSKTWVGQNAVSLGTAPAFEAYTGVRLWYDDENCFFAGDETGRVMEADCPWADQAMAENVLESIKGFVYQPFEAGTALLDMAAELGDGVTVGGIYGPLAFINTSFGGLCASEIGAPSEEEVDHEYPYKPKQQRQMERSFRRVYSLIEKTDSAIRLMVVDEINGLESELEQTASGLETRVKSVEGNYSSLTQTVGGIYTRVSAVEGNYSSLSQDVNSISARVYGLDGRYSELALTVDGFTVTDANGTTRIKGDSIETETLYVDAAHINGTLTADQVVLTGSISWDDLDSGVQSNINNAGGISESYARTLITETLVASPTIAGGKFYDLDQDAYITMDTDYGAGHRYAYLEFYHGVNRVFYVESDNTLSDFDPDQGGSVRVKLSTLAGPLLIAEYTDYVEGTSSSVKPQGHWDFEDAYVTGLPASSVPVWG